MTEPTLPADPDPIDIVREAIAVGTRAARAICVRSETLRCRGHTTHHERTLLQVWSNDLSVASALLAELRKAEHYLDRIRHVPQARPDA